MIQQLHAVHRLVSVGENETMPGSTFHFQLWSMSRVALALPQGDGQTAFSIAR
jgi:hypothetical protein